jgi:3-hydroxybutyrate dehydrogenase
LFGTKRFLEGKTGIVTGSTSGIGLGIAKALASQGCNVVLNGFGDQTEIKKLQAQLANEYKVKVFYHGANLRNANEIRDLAAFALQKCDNKVDILVNNAGIQHVAPVDQFPEDKWEDIMAINLSSVFHATKALLPHMKKQGYGRVVNIASVHGLVGSANKSAYVAAKHGVVGFTKVVALETAGTGVTINSVCPGWVRTPLVEKQIEAKAKERGLTVEQAAVELLQEKQPSKQFVSVEDLAQSVLFFCLPSSNQITGVALPVDGAWVSQ